MLRYIVSILLVSALACLGLRAVQLHYWHFDLVQAQNWVRLWQGFAANEIIFDTAASYAFLASFPLAIFLPLCAVAPLAAALHHAYATLATALLARRTKITQNIPSQALEPTEIHLDPPVELTPVQIREMADNLFRVLFPTPIHRSDEISPGD